MLVIARGYLGISTRDANGSMVSGGSDGHTSALPVYLCWGPWSDPSCADRFRSRKSWWFPGVGWAMCKMCKGLVVVVVVLSGSRTSDAGYSSRGNSGTGVGRVHCKSDKSGEAVNTAAISKPDGAEEHNWPQLATVGYNWKKSRQGEPEDRS